MNAITSTATTEEKMGRAEKKDESVYNRSKQCIINMYASSVVIIAMCRFWPIMVKLSSIMLLSSVQKSPVIYPHTSINKIAFIYNCNSLPIMLALWLVLIIRP